MLISHHLRRLALMLAATSLPALAAVPAEEAARLGKDLTPVGAERAANDEGSIPAWTGGYDKIPAGFKPGGHYPNPFAGDEPLFVIDASNYKEYADKLSPGQIALFERYPDTRKMKVHRTRRSARYPQGIYDETRANATKVELVDGGNGFRGTTGGYPFPIPQDGVEAIWNHLTVYKGDTYATSWAQAPVTANGDYNLVTFDYEYDFVYGHQGKRPEERQENLLFYFLQAVTGPARLAGSILLVYDYADQVAEQRKAWVYNPGARRVRLAPNVAYDNPGTASDGLRTNDDFFMFNGATDRYNWELVGKKEMYIPYNGYKINGPDLKLSEVLTPGHVNSEHARYELHRVWHVRATLKKGTSHIYKTRDFFLDEDSFVVHVTDKYDNRDSLWRVSEQHSYLYYDVPFLAPGLEVHHDLNAGRYVALSLRNDEKKVYEPIEREPSDFRPDALRMRGRR